MALAPVLVLCEENDILPALSGVMKGESVSGIEMLDLAPDFHGIVLSFSKRSCEDIECVLAAIRRIAPHPALWF